MKKTIKLSLLLLALLSMVSNKTFAYDIQAKNADDVIIYYKFIKNNSELEVTYKTTNYNSYSGTVVIPATVTYNGKSYPVTSIGDYAFCYCSGLTSVTIPNSVTSIGYAAFYKCSGLIHVTIPNSVISILQYAFDQCTGLLSASIGDGVKTIGDYAFYDCNSMTSVTMGNSITSIGIYAFASCRGLSSIIIPNSVTIIKANAFGACTGLTSVTFGNSVTTIEKEAFYNCRGIESLTIPNSVTTIGYGAFAFCRGFKSVTIPSSVTSMGYNPFWDSFLTDIYVDKDNQHFVSKNGILYSKDMSLLISYPAKKTDTSYSIPNSVITIGKYAICDCDYLNNITIPNSVTTIEDYAFYHSSSITSITLPNSVTSIGNAAFNNCNLTTVVSQIESPFYIVGKSSESYRTFNENTFNEATLYVPVGTIDKYKATEGWMDFVNIKEGDGSGGSGQQEDKKCEKPIISYKDAKLYFQSSTEGATYHYSISDSDIKSGTGEELQLSVTYHVSVYATKSGYENSEVAEGTLCWIEIDPQKEGIGDLSDGVGQVKAMPVLIQAEDGAINVQGAPDNAMIAVYGIDGTQAGSAESRNGLATIHTQLPQGSIAVVKIGERSVKVMMK